MLKIQYKLASILVFTFVFCKVNAQDLNQEIGFRLDNDALFFTDDYYSNGIEVSYSRKLNQSFIFFKDVDNNLQLNVSLANHMYTPSTLKTSDVSKLDRPYAGWTFVKAAIQNARLRSNHLLSFETGITGKASQTSNLHQWYHRALNLNVQPTWVEQITSKWLFNVKYDYSYDVIFKTKNIFQYKLSSSIGTKDMYAQSTLNYIFGSFDSSINSARNNLIGTGRIREFFAEVSVAYRYVFHNTLIEGALFNNNDPFTLEATNHLFLASLGSVYRHNKNTYRIKLMGNSNETTIANWHFYLSLCYSRMF